MNAEVGICLESSCTILPLVNAGRRIGLQISGTLSRVSRCPNSAFLEVGQLLLPWARPRLLEQGGWSVVSGDARQNRASPC